MDGDSRSRSTHSSGFSVPRNSPTGSLSLSLSLSLFSPLPFNYCYYYSTALHIHTSTTTAVPPFLILLFSPSHFIPLSLSLSLSFFLLFLPPIFPSLSLSPLPPFGTPLWVVRSAHQKSSPPISDPQTLFLQLTTSNTTTTTTTTSSTPLPLTNVVTKRRWFLPLYARR